jgi:predicted component of type VI protein secretion system
VLRVFSTCTVEMQRARDRQCAELGVTWDPPSDGLGACERGEDLLRYLIDWRDPGEARSEELVRAFAGLVDHAQSFLQAALKAARGAVFSLSPSEMERTLASTWPTRTVALWRHYEATFSAFYGDTYDNLTPKFRAALAEAYSQALTRLGVAFQQHKRRGAP